MKRYNKNRVLLVSCFSATRKRTEDALEAEGFEIMIAETGQQALLTMRERLIDAIILDHRTPFARHVAPSGGSRILEAITDANPLLRLVLLCGKTTDLSYAASMMADMILKEPFDSSLLLDAVETVLEETLRERAHRKGGIAAALQ